MTVKEFISKAGIKENSTKNLCFVVGKVFGEGNCKELYYRTSPMHCIWEWFDYLNNSTNPEENILNYYVLNIQQPVVAWLSGVDWNNGIKNGHFISLLVISDKEFKKYYSENQCEQTINYIEKKINDMLEDSSHLRMLSFINK